MYYYLHFHQCKKKHVAFNLLFLRLFLPFTSLPVQAVPSPICPALQLHTKLPSSFTHVASISQLCIKSLHSSMSVSMQKNTPRQHYVLYFSRDVRSCKQINSFAKLFLPLLLIPAQKFPSPVYPTLQAHAKLSLVLVHVAFLWQLLENSLHSFLYIKKNANINKTYTYLAWLCAFLSQDRDS